MSNSLLRLPTKDNRILKKYLTYTASPTRDKDQRRKDFDDIRKMDMIAGGVTFYRPHILVVGTKPVFLKSRRGFRYEIGEFLIYLIRKREGRRWITEFYFENITNPVIQNWQNGAQIGQSVYDHPHILRRVIPDDFEHLVGNLCIVNGQHSVYQAIREARIPTAVAMLIRILHTIDRGGTYIGINNWPRASFRKGD